jgi:hypothetical protein
MFAGAVALAGDFVGNRDAGIRYRFRFCDGGVYFYLAERADHEYTLWQLAHRGHWELTRSMHAGGKTAMVLKLKPEYMDITPAEREAIPLLQERALPTDRLEKYLISASELQRGGDPQRKTYYCTVPDPRGVWHETGWHIETA